MVDGLSEISNSELVLIDSSDYQGKGQCEAPTWHPDGYLIFARHRLNELFRWDPATGQSRVIRTDTGRTTGCLFDLEGRLVCCEGDHQRVTRTDPGPEGALSAEDWPRTPTVIADQWEGKRLNRPNDVAMRTDGTLYFTDPVFPSRTDAVDIPGVYRIAPNGELDFATGGCETPNGIALSPDEKILYVANTKPRSIRAFDVAADGTLSNNRVFASLEYDVPPNEGPDQTGNRPDGMTVDTDGRIYCTSGGGIWIFASSGDLIGILQTPGKPRNVGFGGDDFTTLFICAYEEVYRLETKVKGIPTYLPR